METYNLILNTTNATNIINDIQNNKVEVVFNVNWESLLPKKYSKYNVRFQFFTEKFDVPIVGGNLILPEKYIISSNFQSKAVLQNNSNKCFLGTTKSTLNDLETLSRIEAEIKDNFPVSIHRPTEFLTIQIYNVNGTLAGQIPHNYTIILNFSPILE
jgi:hypothetical protein